jgi:glucan endo-1,3-alpha-glucosidase
MVSDSIFVSTFTKSGGSITVTSGSNAPVTTKVSAGVQMVEIPMGVGIQSFQMQTADGKSVGGSGNVSISDGCWVSVVY